MITSWEQTLIILLLTLIISLAYYVYSTSIDKASRFFSIAMATYVSFCLLQYIPFLNEHKLIALIPLIMCSTFIELTRRWMVKYTYLFFKYKFNIN